MGHGPGIEVHRVEQYMLPGRTYRRRLDIYTVKAYKANIHLVQLHRDSSTVRS